MKKFIIDGKVVWKNSIRQDLCWFGSGFFLGHALFFLVLVLHGQTFALGIEIAKMEVCALVVGTTFGFIAFALMEHYELAH